MSVSNIRTAIIATYSVVACIAFGLGYFIHPTAAICVLLGPSAWLIHGMAGVPLFVAATLVILIAGILALLVVGRFSHPAAIWIATVLTACVWLAIGWVAWILPPYMS